MLFSTLGEPIIITFPSEDSEIEVPVRSSIPLPYILSPFCTHKPSHSYMSTLPDASPAGFKEFVNPNAITCPLELIVAELPRYKAF